MKALITALVLLYCAGLSALLIGLDYYTFAINKTNHTATPISWMLALYLGNVLAGSAFLIWRPTELVHVRVVWCVIVVSALGILNIVIFDALNIMMEYDRWAKKGLPDRPR